MSSSPNTSLSDYSSPWTSKDSQYKQQDSSVLWMLKELDIIPNHKPEPLPAFEAQDDEAQQLLFMTKFMQQAECKSTWKLDPTHNEVITKSFLRGRSQWVDEPVITRWREPSSELRTKLEMADQLYHKWRQSQPAPFDPFFDRLWLETAATLRDAGLPWHNNNLNMPEEIDTR
jgi:hypothetical protein